MDLRQLEPFGEHAVRILLGAEWAADLGGRAALSRALLDSSGVSDALVGETHALVVVDDPSRGDLRAMLTDALEGSRGAPLRGGAARRVDVVYDGADLEEVGRTLGVSTGRVVALHTERPLHVSFVGFLPGFAYLRGLPLELATLPRRASPRARVPAGSVAIAGGMSAVYPSASPGGWNLLGHAPAFDPLGVPLAIGDVVHFREGDARDAPTAVALELPLTAVGLRIERIAGVALIVDGSPRRALRDGAPPGGPLVSALARRALAAAGCGDDDALVERYGALTVSVTGDEARAVADETGRTFMLRPGQSLEIPWSGDDRVGYLAIAGGLDTPLLLGGRGTLLSVGRGGFRGRPLRRGDVVPLGDPSGPAARRSATRDLGLDPQAVLVAQRGPDLLDLEHAVAALRATSLRIAHASDRTGTRLIGTPPLTLRTRPAHTAPVMRGAIQAPPSGELIVLGPDHPITGGYPVIGVLGAEPLEALFTRPIGAEVRLRIV